MMYPLVRDLLFNFPPESVHHFSMNSLKSVCNFEMGRKFIEQQFSFPSNQLSKTVFGIHFPNPVGLGAGFDKNAAYLRELKALGFGFVEIGTVTPKAQSGNSQPRLFRLPADKALINRMGFNNDGVEMVKRRLADWKLTESRESGNQLIIGGNLGKNKITENQDAWQDYLISFNSLFEYADYFVVNVSSPNTPGLRELQEKDALYKILSELQNSNQGKQKPKPLLLKIAPDLSQSQLDTIVSLSLETKLSGLVATNTTIAREPLSAPSLKLLETIGAGGLSGAPLRTRASEVVTYLAMQCNHQLPIIASGGIFTGPDAAEKLAAGASLVQVWTGFIYEGPGITKNICTYLAKHNA